MAVLIKGMEMPAECRECNFCICYTSMGMTICEAGYFIIADENKPIAFEGRHKNCPLVEIPEHGRLIDADELWEKVYEAWGIDADAGECSFLMNLICDAPTIIPASKEET